MYIKSRLAGCSFASCVLLILVACSSEDSSPAVAESDEARACRQAAEAMIDVAREAVNDSSSRPQRRESRRVLMEGWIAALEAGEDPCVVYGDIGRASTTF